MVLHWQAVGMYTGRPERNESPKKFDLASSPWSGWPGQLLSTVVVVPSLCSGSCVVQQQGQGN